MSDETNNVQEPAVVQSVEPAAEPTVTQEQNTKPPKDTTQEPVAEQKKEEVTEDFVKSKLTELLGDVNNEALTKEFSDQLKEIGITDQTMAEKALKYVCSARAERIIADCAEVMKYFGATEDNLTPEYTKAMDEAKTALSAIDKKVPGIKQVIDEAGIHSNLKVVLMFQKLLPFVGEASGGINSDNGVGVTKAEVGFMDTVFAGYPSEADNR